MALLCLALDCKEKVDMRGLSSGVKISSAKRNLLRLLRLFLLVCCATVSGLGDSSTDRFCSLARACYCIMCLCFWMWRGSSELFT